MADGADTTKLPRLFYVNWFRKDADGRWLWPGFGENSRVLAWIVERVAGRAAAEATPIGMVPAPGAIDTGGLDLSAEDLDQLLRVDVDEWRREVPSIEAHYAALGVRLPARLRAQLAALADRLSQSRAA
jgi:phosphoenolpyruvate carboxykinase (GTP)